VRSGFDLTILDAPEGHWAFSYVEVTNFDGTWVTLGDVGIGALSNADFVSTAGWDDSIDQNTPTFTAQLIRDVGAYSLVPFRSDSPLNVDDASAYSPLLDLHRFWRWWICVLPVDTFPASPADYREFGRGIVDRIDVAGDPAIITVKGRGMEADIIDALIVPPNTYAAATLPDFLQDILDQQFGAGAIPLTVDGSAPTDFMDELDRTWNGSSTDATPVGAFALLDQSVALFGGSLRYKYDSSDVLSFTLYTVNRTPSTPDWVLNGNRYSTLDAGIDLGPIRTNVVVRYVDDDFGVQTVYSPVSLPSAASARYGVRTLVIDLAADTRVTTQARAGGLADAARSDLEFPIIEQTISGRSLWFAELGDYVQLVANGVHYDQDQFGGITSISHRFQNGDLVSTIGFRGNPAGRYRTWLDFGPGAPRAPFTPVITQLAATFTEATVALIRVAYVTWSATVNQYTQSVKAELSTTDDFAVVLQTEYADVASGVAAGLFSGVTRDQVYFVRATPYSGPVVSGVSTGQAGAPVIDSTFVQFEVPSKPQFDSLAGDVATLDSDLTALADEPFTTHTPTLGLPNSRAWVDSSTATIDVATAGAISVDVIGVAEIAGAVGEIGIPIWFYKTPLPSAQWLTEATIPALEQEMGSGAFRRQHYLAGAGRGRWHAIVKAGTPTLKLKSSTDAFGTSADVDSLSITGTGYLVSPSWTALPSTAQDDVRVAPFLLNGAGTASVDFYALWYEVLPDLVTAFRDFSDDFSDDFS
jgi:hypothetical protein